jgi:DNA repair exonuclease SbcCD ATPase subunit
MKTVKLKSIKINNFKGLKELEISFDSSVTNIYGKNGVGKSSICDAYSWLLFGKNSQNQSDFGLKTLDPENNPINHLEHSVEGTFIVDEEEITLKRVYLENWTKKKGEQIQRLTGHTTNYYYNDVPLSLAEYKLKVDSIISEEFQKLLSNPLYFNSVLAWKDRRVVLSKIVGEISDKEVYSTFKKESQEQLQTLLSSGKTLEDYKREYAVKRKKIKDELDLIPSRIDEAHRSLPEAKNWGSIDNDIQFNEAQIRTIDSQIEDATKQMDSKFAEVNNVKQIKFQKEQELQAVINEETIESKKEYNKAVAEANDVKHIIQLNMNNAKQQFELIQEIQGKIERHEEANNQLRNQFTEENAKVFEFDSTAFSCNSCQREYDTDKIEEIKANALTKFKAQQEQIISEIRNTGGANKVEIDKCKTVVDELKKKKDGYNSIIETKQAELKKIETTVTSLAMGFDSQKEDSPKVIQLKKEISEIAIPEVVAVDNSILKLKKSELQAEIDTLKLQLHDKVQIEKGNARIEELSQQQRTLAQEIASFEQVEMLIDKFNNSKMDLIEQKVNDKFSLVKFKMFNQLVNQTYEDCCILISNGVEWSDLNTATKINSGLEVIKVLSEFYEVSAPIFLDSKESVSSLLPIDSQLITLSVDEKCEAITIR